MTLEIHLDPKPKKVTPGSRGYLINYSLKWLNSLSREPFVL